MTLTIDDYAKLRKLVSSKVTCALSDPALLCTLHEAISGARLVEPEDLPGDVVAMDSMVVLRDIRSQATETYTLVCPDSADIARRRLSVLSPAGVAVLGCRIGDLFRWPAASGGRIMKVESVVSQEQVQPAMQV